MRKHGWQLPYHPLQVVAIASFLALGFAFYVFFLPFIGRKLLEYVVLGLYTPLVICVFCVYVWCAATDPGDPGIFKSKKYLNIDIEKQTYPRVSRQGGEIVSSSNKDYTVTTGDKPPNQGNGTDAIEVKLADKLEREKSSCPNISFLVGLLGWCPFTFICSQHRSHEQSSEQEVSEDGMFYCSLCEVEVLKYSKHCRVCDKCVDGFDHHCRWLNNCIGRKNYRRFFILMVSALLLLILQWSIGVLVLILCFLERKRFSVEIISKLGSSFSLVPFVAVVATCTVLAMIATLPLAQLFFFHVLLIRKGISTYDYIIALREKEQQGVAGLQSPQMSSVSSLTGLSSASSFSAFHRGAWCTPPRLFLEDQFDVVPPEAGMSVSSAAKRVTVEELAKKNNPATVKISPWTLARLSADEVSRAAAQARKKSRILQPIGRREIPPGRERDSTFSSGSDRMVPWPDNRRRPNKRGRMPTHLPITMISSDLAPETSSTLAPLQLEARNAFRTSRAMPSIGIPASSPDSSLGSPDIHPFRVSSSGAEEALSWKSPTSAATAAAPKGTPLSRSTSDGYEASGGEDSDRVPSRIMHRSSNWSNLLFNAGYGNIADKLKASSSAGLQADARPR